MTDREAWRLAADELPPEDEMVEAWFSAGGLCAHAICYYDGAAGWFEVHGDNSDLVDMSPKYWRFLLSPESAA